MPLISIGSNQCPSFSEQWRHAEKACNKFVHSPEIKTSKLGVQDCVYMLGHGISFDDIRGTYNLYKDILEFGGLWINNLFNLLTFNSFKKATPIEREYNWSDLCTGPGIPCPKWARKFMRLSDPPYTPPISDPLDCYGPGDPCPKALWWK